MIYIFVVIALIMIYLSKTVVPGVVYFKPKAYFSFLRLLGIATLVRLLVNFFMGASVPPDFVNQFTWHQFFLVFWEDMFFVFPLFFFAKRKNTLLFYVFLMLSSLSFASGHLYQSYVWASILLLYPTVMYRIAKKHGLGTVMISHITYDMITYLTMLLFLRMM